ncbi:sugar phosphate nucleotidyltransferase [Vibrio mediterranei]|uniref:sugar phosphate nucleotidyltransferase n=1 Tax=Vibrio mediterranei TaxID=689 RepID=UPI00148BDAC8|nr:sugar phosphate nucleotidyltransferase [Vibrio mediterranei]NOH31326.1 NTP transferase domain-containing protein [Vibrio mediterranei]
MEAIILCGGEGTRLWPYNLNTPKSLTHVANKPIVAYSLESLLALGITNITLLVKSISDGYHQQLGKIPILADALSKGAITINEVGETNGPADTLGRYMTRHATFSDAILLLFGDQYVSRDGLQSVIDNTNNNVALFRYLTEDKRSDRIAYDLTSDEPLFFYHPRRAGYDHELCALKCDRQHVRRLTTALPSIYDSVQCGMMPSNEKFIAPLVAELSERGTLTSLVTQKGYHLDYPWDILSVNQYMTEKLCGEVTQTHLSDTSTMSKLAISRGQVKLGDNSYIGDQVILKGNVIIGNNTNIIDGAIVGNNVIIGNNCVIKDRCRIADNSVIGDNCVIGHCAELEGVINRNTYLYHHCEIYGLLGQSVDIGAGTSFGNLRFDDARVSHNIHGKRITPMAYSNAVYLGDFVRTGVNTSIMPGVKVGSRSVIGSNVCLNEDVKSNTIIYVKQDLKTAPWGNDVYGR